MVHVSLRQNRLGATDQNTTERHSRGPGSPLTEVPGDGLYDWAGRRLFLPDGQPDPHTPGAYRYQHDPDCTDLSAPDSDPASPRYEPPHLRHQPGDTWEIGGKPHDPEDPGPYGTPGWYQDGRTGRHRRNELPDPLPPEQERPRPTPRYRPRFWTRPEPEASAERTERTDHSEHTEHNENPHQFTRLQEDAWDRWLIDSAPLAAAHAQRSAHGHDHGRTVTAFLLVLRWVIAVFGSRTAKTAPEPVDPHDEATDEATAPTPDPGRTSTKPPRPQPYTGNGYIHTWEVRFDARHPITGGGLS
ncbi:hypothetical protein [Glycomyces arizonensis]|uniref:hypothetical protein n=1 Tax=Glycomyces arizonensis TaxID=256035 RepID=UPI0004135DE0|nr:hypothetical protein [Glycomyces arizonensis]